MPLLCWAAGVRKWISVQMSVLLELVDVTLSVPR